ncbi:hypothetical protein [Konateibacter massiliensis]|uniref:hypothetical protein n=1 Tax=Konateibacter massiliensis TaxID=2002841 RepID=UPI0015D4C54C|nr:hypothetical protein [Konateibacter massiliensis]
MRITGIMINGIEVIPEHGHYLLQKDNTKMRCDFGELNECIPEFEEYLEEAKQKLQTA